MKKILLAVFCLFSLMLVVSCANDRLEYDITFETNGGSTIEPQKVYHDKTVARPEVNPSKEGHTFIDWYADEALTTVYNFETRVRKSFSIYAKWDVNSYKLSYVTNVNGYEIKEKSVKFGSEIDVPEIDEEKFIVTGSTFDGWYLDAEFTEVFSKMKMPAKNVTLYANWIKNDHKVNVYVDDIEQEPITVKYGDTFADIKNKIQTPTKNGFDFVGWFLSKNDTAPITDSYIITKDIELHAKWAAKTYTLSFNSNGGSEIGSVTYPFQSSINTPASPTKVGYAFAGWYIGEEIFDFNSQRMPAENITLEAKWIATQYTVSYYPNTGNGSLEDSKLTIEQELSLKTNTFTKIGYTFLGWNTKADGTGVSYTDGAKITINKDNPENIKLYAQWVANTYTINFNGNGVNAPESINTKYDENITLPQALERTGYTFLGWNTKADGTGVNYASGQTVKNLSTGEDLTLYANWKQNTYVFTINIQNELTEINLHYGDVIPVQADPVIDGYDFDGWYAFIDEVWVPFTFENATMPNENLTIAAKFLGEVSITFITNGSVHKTLTGFEGNSIDQIITDPVREGYTFAGWYTDNAFLNSYILPTVFPNESYNVYAKWDINNYIVTFNSDNGDDVIEHTLSFGDTLTEPEEPKKEGYTFAGWYYDNNPVVFTTFTVPANDIEIVAKWTINEYTIEFDVNGGSNVSTTKYDYNAEVTLPTTTKEGYDFIGWFIEDTETEFTFTTMPAKNYVLYAKWEAKEYTLIINTSIKGVAQTPINTTVKFDQLIKDVVSYTPLEGHSFNGWYIDEDLKEKYTFNDATTVDGNLTLYADFEINTYTVNFISDGKIVYTTTSEYEAEVSFNSYVNKIKEYNDAYLTLKNAVGGVIAGIIDSTTLKGVIVLNQDIYESEKNLAFFVNIALTNTLDNKYISDGTPNWEAFYQDFYSYLSSLCDTSQALLNQYEAGKLGENYGPIKADAFFAGWFLGADTVYNSLGTGNPFLGFTPASTIGSNVVNIVALWEALKAVDDLAADKNNANTIIWTQINKDQLKPGEGQYLVVKYYIYSKNSDGSLTLLDTVLHDDSKEKLSYTFMTKDTFGVPGVYNLLVTVGAEIILESNNDLIRSYHSKESESNILKDYHVLVSPDDVTIEKSGDYYHKDGSTFYFFTNVNYDFPTTNSFDFVSGDNIVTIDGSSIHTTESTGTFKFNNTSLNNEGTEVTVEYLGIVLPYISQFTLSKDLSIIAESNANSSMFRGKDATYTIGRAYDDINDEDNNFIQYRNLFEYENNGFRFEMNVLTKGGKTIDILEFGNYLTYEFFDENGTLIDNDSMGEYKSDEDYWMFTAECGNYKVKISINTLYVPKKLVDDEIIKPIEFNFTLDNSINIYTHEQFKAIFADTKIGNAIRGSNGTSVHVKRGISLHKNIEAELDSDQYYDTTNPNSPFIGFADDGKKAGHTPITAQQNKVWENREYSYGSVYSRFATDLNESYVINGNCFEISGVNLPFASIYAEENLSNVTGYEIPSVHMAIIHYIVSDTVSSKESTSNSNLYVNDLKIVGNTRKYNSEADGSTIEAMNRNSGGYLGVMVSFGCNLIVDNSIVLNTTVALNPNNDSGATISNTVLKNCFSNAIYAYDNDDISVINCYLEEAGGAAIHVEDKESYKKTKSTAESDIYATDTKIYIDNDTQIINYVSGDEGFFKSRSMEIMITGMKAQFQAGATSNGMTMLELVTDPITGLQTEKINFIMLMVCRGDNTQEDGPWNLDANGNKTYTETGAYEGMNYNMMQLSFGSNTMGIDTIQNSIIRPQVEAQARMLVEQQVRSQVPSGTPEEYIQTLIEEQMQSAQVQSLIQENIVANTPALTSYFLNNFPNKTDMIVLSQNNNNINNFGSGYMLTGYEIPTFGNSMIVTGVKGLPKQE